MPREVGICVVKVVVDNEKAVRGLWYALETLEEEVEDNPWKDDLRRARNALRYAAKHLEVK